MPFGIGAAVAVKAGSSLLNFASNRFNRGPKFEDSEYARLLRKRKSEGDLSGSAQRSIIGGVAQSAGNVAQNRKALIRGNLIKGGFGDSIAGQALLDRPGADLQSNIADVRRNLTTSNELSKVNAESELARLMFENKIGRSNQSRGDFNQLISGVGGAASDYFKYNALQNQNGPQSINIGDLPGNFFQMDQNGIIDFARQKGIDPEPLLEFFYNSLAQKGGR